MELSTQPSTRGVIVKQLPAVCDARQAKAYIREVAENITEMIRPGLVLDCSLLQRIDCELLYLMLCCLEEAMKRNGDVRLAGIPAQLKATLELIGMDRLFRVFATAEEAVESLRRHALPQTAVPAAPGSGSQPSAHAA